MPEDFFIADLHLGHQRMVSPDPDGTRLRPWETVEAMNEGMIERWNAAVRPKDRVYVLGDLMMNKRYHPLLSRLNGARNVLIAGNHDEDHTAVYLQYFSKVQGARVYRKNIILTHIPVHPSQVERRFVANIHGHLHGESIGDPRYFCVSAEQVGYAPMPFSLIAERLRQSGVAI